MNLPMYSQDSFLLIIDYNLSRIDDVASLQRYAYERYGLKTILIRADLAPHDYQIADHVLVADPRAANFVPLALKALAPFRQRLRGGLVFSDNAVQSGAQLLEALNFLVDNADLAIAAFSKLHYRQIETEQRSLLQPQGIFIPAYSIIHDKEELENFIDRYPAGAVLKPACEGNNRGVLFLNSLTDMQQAFQEVAPYLEDGLICEQVIPFQQEYSFDGLAHLSFVTQKCSATGRYPVETGQILPGKITPEQHHLISRTGRLANLLIGQCHGPFHNEIKVDDDATLAAVIEPNRRPAGMKIWSLAERVYGVNFYHLWVDQALGQSLPEKLPVPQGVAATIMLGAPKDGFLDLPQDFQINPRFLFERMLNLFQHYGNTDDLKWFDFTLLARPSNQVRAIPKDNGDFLAQVCVYSPDSSLDILAVKSDVSRCWNQAISRYLLPENAQIAVTV